MEGDSNVLLWTGERFLPYVDTKVCGVEIHYEHIHRYVFASQFTRGKAVLDLASGEGYGSYILSSTASLVTGIDIDVVAVEHARNKYAKPNIEFLTGSITNIPIAGAKKYDVIVCFEALEHVGDHNQLLAEINRLIKDDGILIISTPNKQEYNDGQSQKNPFHVRELYLEEFRQLLEKSFSNVRIYGQKVFVGSDIWPLERTRDHYSEFLVEKTDREFSLSEKDKKLPLYYLAIASNSASGDFWIEDSSLIDVSNTLINQAYTYIKILEDHAYTTNVQVSQLTTQLHASQETTSQQERKIGDLSNDVSLLAADNQRIAADHSFLSQRYLALEHENAVIKGSFTWRAITGLQRLIDRAMPHSTRRRKAYDLVFHGLRVLSSEGLRSFLWRAEIYLNPVFRFEHGISKKVSICIVNYNGKKYLKDCLDSLNSLDFPREQVEIILVDNGSTDGSQDFIKSEYKDVVLVESAKNLGFAGGNNLGIKHSRGEYLVLLNNDTTVDRHWLTELVRVADSSQDISIVGSKLLFKNEPGLLNNAGSYLTINGDGGDIGFREPDLGQYDFPKQVFAACGASMLIKRSLVETIGLFDEKFFMYYEDMDLCYRTNLYGKKIYYTPNSVVYHVHCGSSGEWSPFFTFHVFRNKLFLHVKNSDPLMLSRIFYIYLRQLSNDMLKSVHRTIHLKLLLSLMVHTPMLLVSRLNNRLLVKRGGDRRITNSLKNVGTTPVAVKKICYYNAYFPTMGGGENLMAVTLESLEKIFPGAKIDILCHNTGNYSEKDFTGVDLVDKLKRSFNVTLNNTSLRYVNFASVVTMKYNNLELAKITQEYDLFINNTFQSMLVPKSTVNIFYCMFPTIPPVGLGFIDRHLVSWYIADYIKSHNRFLSISRYTQAWLKNYYGIDSDILYPTIKLTNQSVNGNKDNIILSIGRFFISGHSKRQDILLSAFIEMYGRGYLHDWKLVFVGHKHTDPESVEYIKKLESMAKGYPVVFKYSATSEELTDLLNRSKIYWHATGYGMDKNTDPVKFEHFGISTLEAMHYGTIPVVINAGGQPELVTNGENGYVWDTTDELMNYTISVAGDARLQKTLSNNAFITSTRFSKEQFHEKLKIYLKSLNICT